jgi:hypothetical protein
MFVVTTQANGTTAGCLVGFACQERPASVIACARESLTTTGQQIRRYSTLLYATMIACVRSPARCAAGL